ncbi:MAG: PucR family transcriptional regulator [Pseudomonadales bacterium]
MESLPEYQFTALSETLSRLSDSPILPTAVAALHRDSKLINTQLGETVMAQIPAFSATNNPNVLPELSNQSAEHTAEILRLLGGGAVGDFKFVHEHAKRRAEQHFPLEATLHAYRCGHKVYSNRLRDAVLNAITKRQDTQQVVADVADFSIEYTDAVSTIATGAYVAQTRLLADVVGDQRAELLNILLEGYDEADGRVAKVLRNAGYLARRQSYCVALAQSVDPAEMLNPARARRMVDSVDKKLRSPTVRHLIDLRDNKVTIIFSASRRASGWTAAHTALATQVGASLSTVGNAALIGVSNDVPSTAQIPNAYKEALLAFELADVRHRVVEFAKIPTFRLLQLLAGEEFKRVLPAWARALYQADDKMEGALSSTLRSYANANMNVLKTAQYLSIHPNTIYARLQKINDITGLDARAYHELTELLVTIECRRL